MTKREIRSPGVSEEELVREALARRGFEAGSYAVFFLTCEGIPLPIEGEEVEEASGYVVDRAGHYFLFWLGWDEQRQAPALTHWEPVTADPRWLGSREYRAALQEVGLALS